MKQDEEIRRLKRRLTRIEFSLKMITKLLLGREQGKLFAKSSVIDTLKIIDKGFKTKIDEWIKPKI